MLMPRWLTGLVVASVGTALVALLLTPVGASSLPSVQASVLPDTGGDKDPCPVPAAGKLRSDAECDLVVRLVNNSSSVSTFSISESGAADALDESVFSPSLPGKGRLGECPCEVTVAANSQATFGLRVVVDDVTPGWYTSRIRVHRLHTGGRLLASFQLKIDEVDPDWDVTVSHDSVSLAEADDPGTVGAWEHQAAYSVRLTEEPSGDVTVTPVSADTSVVAVSQALTFTAGDWQTPQTVTVTAVDDDIDNAGDRHASIRHDVSGVGSGDVMVDDVAVVVADDDTRGVSVSAGSLRLLEADDPDTGGVLEHRGAYTVQLSSEPAGGDVTVDLASGDTSVATVTPATLTFTSADWSTAQTVTVTAVDDNANTASSRQTSIAHTVASADDYAGVTAADVAVTVNSLHSGPCATPTGGDYDIDDDGLIEICSLAQLNAVRWDLDGDGAADVYPPDKHGFTGHDPHGAAKLAAAFPNAVTGMGCPTGGCEGYELSADLDFDTNANGRADPGDDYWNNGLGWHPLIGGERVNTTSARNRLGDSVLVDGTRVCCGDRPHPRAKMFTAEFEGNGRTIANLYINDSHLFYAGLFGIVGPDGIVRNVGLTAPNADSGVFGRWYVGALTGDIERGRVSGVWSDLDVSGRHMVGGLAGTIWGYGSMIESYATGDVTGKSMVGGLLGQSSRSGVAAVYATGDVTVEVGQGGGLVGASGDGHLRAAYAAGSVTYTGPYYRPNQGIGGLVGGGLVGVSAHASFAPWMRANYATGYVSSPNAEITVGGFAGDCRGAERKRSEGNNYWDAEATGGATSPRCGAGYTTAQLQAPTGYTGIYEDWNVDVDVGSYYGSFLGPGDDPWDFGTSAQYPVLKYCAEKPGIETPDGQPYCPLQPDNQRGPSSGQVGTVSNPVVNVAAATNLREGETIAFVIAANPSPSADLPVNISVTATGDYGVTAETKTVTVPAGGSYTLGVATADDNVDEDDGTVTVTVDAGTGYAVSETAGAARVTVADDDVPKISIAAVDADITEGRAAEFALTAVPLPASPLSVKVSVAQSGEFGVSTGSRQVTLGTSGTAALSVATSGDSVDEVNGSVTATVRSGSGYSVSSSARSASVAVQDDDHDDSCVVALWGDGSVSGTWARGFAGWFIVPSQDDGSVSGWWADSCSSAARAGTYARFYTFSLDSPSQVTVDLESPHGHDTYLYLRAGSGQRSGEALASDDDSGDRNNARIHRQLAAGDYTIEATTYRRLVSGPFTLTVAGIPAQTAVQPDPEVSIAAGADTDEGGAAVFTVTADPAPAAPLDVTVAVMAAGDFGVSPGSHTVTVPTTGSATLTVATANDSADEADGSVTATVSAGTGYAVSATAGAATVAVADDDDPVLTGDPCVVALSGDGSVAGGWAAGCVSSVRGGRYALFYSFSLDASSQVTVDLESSVDTYMYLRAGVGQKQGAVLESDDDGGDGYDSRIRRTLAAGGYTIEATTYRASARGSFTLTVAGIPAQTAVQPDAELQPDPEVSITAGADIDEGDDATFTVTATPAPSVGLDVTVAVTASGDFGAAPGSRTVTVPTSGSATFTVATADDTADEPDGSVTVTVSAGTGYTVSTGSGSATLAVADDDEAADDEAVPVCVPSLPSDAVTVAEVTGWRDGHSGSAHVLRWNRVLAALGVDTGVSAMTVEQSRANESVFMFSRWDRVTRTLEALAQCDDPALPPPSADPEISITAGADVAEGGSAAFTVIADPAPSAALTVTVSVAQTGDFGAATGSRQVIIPTSGTAALAVATTDDAADEADGSVTATINTGSGYTVSTTAGAASVAVADDDDPPPPPPVVDPEVSITAGAGVTEGGDATFTITASPAPSAPLTVDVTVSQSGDFGVTPGTRTVTIPISGSAALTVSTTNDSTDEADGSVAATIGAGSGYTVSATAAAATVAVADDDDPPAPPSDPGFAVHDAVGAEGESLRFRVTLSAAPRSAQVSAYWITSESGGSSAATAGVDYSSGARGWLDFGPGDTELWAQIPLLEDDRQEPQEQFLVKLIWVTPGLPIADGQATMTITDND